MLIIGGGPVGVELAGEISDYYPQKDVTLVHGDSRLLPALPEGAGGKAYNVLSKRGINFVLNEKILNTEGTQQQYESQSGRKFKVDTYLRVAGHDNIWAPGDVNDVPEVKLGALASFQAKKAAKSIRRGLHNYLLFGQIF